MQDTPSYKFCDGDISYLDVNKYAPWLNRYASWQDKFNTVSGDIDLDLKSEFPEPQDLYKVVRTLLNVVALPASDDVESDTSSEPSTQDYEQAVEIESPVYQDVVTQILWGTGIVKPAEAPLKYPTFSGMIQNLTVVRDSLEAYFLAKAKDSASLENVIDLYKDLTSNRQAPYPNDSLNLALRKEILKRLEGRPSLHAEALESLGPQLVEILNTPLKSPYLNGFCQDFKRAFKKEDIDVLVVEITWLLEHGCFTNSLSNETSNPPLSELLNSGVGPGDNNRLVSECKQAALTTLVEALLSYGACPSISDVSGRRALDIASDVATQNTGPSTASCYTALCDKLKPFGAQSTSRNTKLYSLDRYPFSDKTIASRLFEDCKAGDISFFTYMKENPLLVHARNSDGETPLHVLLKHHPDSLQKKVDPSSKTADSTQDDGSSDMGRRRRVKLKEVVVLNWMLQQGVDVNIPDKDGHTAFHLACDGQKDSVILLMMTLGNADLSYPTPSGLTGLHLLARGHGKMVHQIHEAMMSSELEATWNHLILIPSQNGKLPVHLAAYYFGDPHDVTTVLQPSNDYVPRDSHGQSPADYADLGAGRFGRLVMGGSQTLEQLSPALSEKSVTEEPKQDVKFNLEAKSGAAAWPLRKKPSVTQAQTSERMIAALVTTFSARYRT